VADRVVLNPGAGPVEVYDVDAALAAAHADDQVLMVDVGGGMEIPLAELVTDEDLETDLA